MIMAKSTSKLLIATVLGLAAGIGIGILIAPAKGSKTRQRLRKKVIQVAESLEEGFFEKFKENSETDIREDQSNETKT